MLDWVSALSLEQWVGHSTHSLVWNLDMNEVQERQVGHLRDQLGVVLNSYVLMETTIELFGDILMKTNHGRIVDSTLRVSV